jgi:hypothetical protein
MSHPTHIFVAGQFWQIERFTKPVQRDGWRINLDPTVVCRTKRELADRHIGLLVKAKECFLDHEHDEECPGHQHYTWASDLEPMR